MILLLLALLFVSPYVAWGVTTVATDDFNRADSTDLGTEWTLQAGDTAQIVSNRVRDTSANNTDAHEQHSATLGNDQFAQITLASTTGSTGRGAGVLLRAASAGTDTYYGFQLLFNHGGSLTSRIFKVVASSFTSLASESATTWAAGNTLRGWVIGQALTLQRNGSNLLTASDSSLASGKAGLQIYVDTGGALGDIEIDDYLSGHTDWQTVGTLGSTQSASADQSTLVLTTSAACEAANTCVCAVAVDNNQTTDGDEGAVTLSDSTGANTWVKAKEFTNGQGTAQTGATVHLGYTKAGTTIGSGATITATFTNSTSRDAAAMTCWEFSNSIGSYTITNEGSSTLANDAADPGAITISSLASAEYLWLHALASEGPNADAYTWDADYTQFDGNGTTPASGGPASEIGDPTEDQFVSGTWSGSAGTRFTLVDDHPDSSCTDVLTAGTAASDILFGWAAPFEVPAGSTVNNVQVLYYDGKNGNPGTTVRARLRVNGVNYANATTHNPTNGGCNLRTDEWTQNPDTGLAWTVDDVNSDPGASFLESFGVGCTDCDPTVYFGSVRLVVNYTTPSEAADTAQQVRGGFRIFTGTTDTVDVTSTTGDRDYAQVLVALKANAPAGGAAVRGLTLMGVGQ